MPLYQTEQAPKSGRFEPFLRFIEQNSKTVIIVSVLVIVVSCALAAQIIVSRKRSNYLMSKLDNSDIVAVIKQMKDDYEGTDIYPYYLYKLGRLQCDAGNYEEAKVILENLIEKFPKHSITDKAYAIYNTIITDLSFIKKERKIYNEEYYLTIHPQLTSIPDEYMYAPFNPEEYSLDIMTSEGSISIKLYHLELYNTCMELLNQLRQEDISSKISARIYDGHVELEVVGITIRDHGETTGREPERGSVALTKSAEGKTLLVIIKNREKSDVDGLKLIGEVTSGQGIIDRLKDTSTISSVTLSPETKSVE